MAFDNQVTIDGTPFLKHLQDRMHTAQVKALLSTVARRFPAAVVMLDLASEMLAGATMEDVSTVLYYKVLQWAGYSRNLKVAALERKLERDGRYAEFLGKVEAALPGLTWHDLQNDPLVVDGLIPQIAHEMYPALFPSPASFSSSTEGFVQFEDQRVREMLEIVREKSGKEHIIFIVDEVGQYVASRDNLILNLDGLAKNLKGLGNGKAWIIATAQQTLTEDDPRAALNSEKLYKLQARFPIQIDLVSSDIKEICYLRLLGKSAAGETALGRLFDAHGQALRHNTKLQDAKYYDADFTRESFIQLYPFLPAHFDILLHLLGALAKSTGGIGLRSAIKIIQDILVEGHHSRSPVADQPIGWLATTITLFDALDKDIRRAFPSIYQAVGKVEIRFTGSDLHQQIAKSVAVLQILGNLPVTIQNIASLMHPGVTSPSLLEDVRQAVEEMLNDVLVPLGEKDGSICFLSEKLRDIEQERGGLHLRSTEVKRIFNEAVREAFNPLPRVNLHGTMAVATGLKVQAGNTVNSLAGEQSPIQTVVEFAEAAEYETTRTRLLDESRSRSGQNTIALLTRNNPELGDLAGEIHRCERIVELHRNDTDQEIKEYCVNQLERSDRLKEVLAGKIKQALQGGSFIFRGQSTAVAALDQDLLDAARKQLANAAERVFDRYSEAPERVSTDLAEKFLRVANPAAITSALDPLGLVQSVGGRPSFRNDHKAMVSVRDYIDRTGTEPTPASHLTPGEHEVVVRLSTADGQKLAGVRATVSVTAEGEVAISTILIDPYGVVTDALTGQSVSGVKMQLIWADTELNREKGRAPHTAVDLPPLSGFPPADNAIPQWTDSNGTYAWMVFPEGDYYLLAEKDGYLPYDSRKEGRTVPAAPGEDGYVFKGIVHVGQTIVKYDLSLQPLRGRHKAYVSGYPDGTFRPEQTLTRAEAATVLARPTGSPGNLPALRYTDADAAHWAAESIAIVTARGLMLGDPDGRFRPDASLSRAEIAVIIGRLNKLAPLKDPGFADTAGHWAQAQIKAAQAAGLVQGLPGGIFEPERPVTRAEFVTIVHRALGRRPTPSGQPQPFPDVPATHWAFVQVVEAAADHTYELQADGTERNTTP